MAVSTVTAPELTVEQVQKMLLGTDDWGDPIYGSDVDDVFYGEVRPLQGDEKVTAHSTGVITTRFKLFIPATTDITAYDKVVIFGQDFQVKGQPEPHNVSGRIHRFEAIVERIST